MVHFCAVCGCCTRTDIVREHLEDTLRICVVSVMGLIDSLANATRHQSGRENHVIHLAFPSGLNL